MKNRIYQLSLVCFLGILITSLTAFAKNTKQTITNPSMNQSSPPLTCYDFLKNPLVEDQLYEKFDEHANLKVEMDQQQNYCTLTITMPNGKVYEFSSTSPKNFIYENKSIALILYEKNHPKIQNKLEADYEFDQILDVASNFPIVN